MTRTSATNPSSARRGFTLTELLVVIAIVAMLAALVSAGVMTAMSRARATAIKVELDQIDAAMKRYKETFGSYPPSNFGINESGANKPQLLGRIRQHLAMAFPRFTPDNTELELILDRAGLDLDHYRPDQALTFWLRGFSANPLAPIISVDGFEIDRDGTVSNRKATRSNVFYEFDPTRLIGFDLDPAKNPVPSYFASGARVVSDAAGGKTFPTWQSGAPPILYFDSSFYEMRAADPTMGDEAHANQFNPVGAVIFAGAGVAVPYWHDINGNGTSGGATDTQETWANPESFQLVCAGSDGKYGPEMPVNFEARLYPTGTRYDTSAAMADDDNATNFTSAARIGDDKP